LPAAIFPLLTTKCDILFGKKVRMRVGVAFFDAQVDRGGAMCYAHLTQRGRYQIQAWIQAGLHSTFLQIHYGSVDWPFDVAQAKLRASRRLHAADRWSPIHPGDLGVSQRPAC
jgi:hypothetical protein